jgi:DNA invertase Pin-like site-specific DNA recombinase
MKCFIYCRQSVGAAEADDSISLVTQKEECVKLARNKGFTVLDTFADPNTSGRLYPPTFDSLAAIDIVYQRWLKETKKTGKWRNGLGKLLKRLDEVEWVLCYDITRLHRSLRGSFLENMIIQELSSHGVKVMTVKEGEIDFSKFADSLVSTLTSQINSEQLLIQREKARKARQSLKERGEWCAACTKSFGYKSTGRKREAEIDEDKAEIVKTIFKMYTDGCTYPEIAEAIGPQMRKLGIGVFKTHIFRILRNPIYCGFYRGDDGELIKSKPNEGKELITFKMWKTAQEIYEQRKSTPRRAYKNWLPLSGKIKCGYCGDKMRINEVTGGFMRYTCISFQWKGLPHSASCKCNITWSRDVKHEYGDVLLDALMGLLPLYYFHKLEEANRSREKDTAIQEAEIKVMNTQAKIKTLTESFLEGQLDEAVYRSGLASLNKRLKEEKTMLDEASAMKPVEKYTPSKLLFDLEAINAGDVERSELEEAIRWTIKEVRVWKEKIEITTPKGKVVLPVERLGFRAKARLLPFHFIAAGKGECDVVYNWKCREPHSDEDIIDYEEDGKVIGDFGKVKVWLVR